MCVLSLLYMNYMFCGEMFWFLMHEFLCVCQMNMQFVFHFLRYTNCFAD
jgi:hypothetical protein